MTVTTSTRARPGYDDAVARFSIQDAMAGLRGDLQTGLNACVECCDRHVGANRVALRCLSPDEELSEYTFEDLRDLAARAANVFHAQGIRPDEARLARVLLADYQADIDFALAHWDEVKAAPLTELLNLPEQIRGYGHVRERHAEAAAKRRASLRMEIQTRTEAAA